jgi:outer membrane protein OmpA-like peptidoglycan-associated protein
MFKKQLNNKWGVNLDAGVVLNLSTNAKYEANKASFDYEAIYAFDGNGNPIYDNNPTPNPDNWLITKAHYEKVNTDGNVNAYFENLFTQGYNVGLGVNPNNASGEVNNTSISTSWFIRPSVSYRIKPNLALHANVSYQQISTTFASSPNYRITDKRGSYASVSNGINTHSQGLIQFGIGLRYYFGKERVAEPKPKPTPVPAPEPTPAPKAEEPKKEDPYKEMVRVTVKLIDEKYGNGIPGNIVIKTGSKEVFNGTAEKSGLSNFYLEPGSYTIYVSAKGYIPVEEPLSLSAKLKGTSRIIELKQPKIEKGLVFKLKAINFETGSNQLTQSSYDILNRMAAILLEYPQMVIEVGGHTDNVGDDQKNLVLSENRAKSVADYLMGRGVKANQLKAVGYGETKPVSDNETEEGRRLNRRVMFTVLDF